MHMTPEDRFFLKVVENGECWDWVGYINDAGYGLFRPVDRTRVRAHRWCWEFFNGPIPEGLELDHLCRNRRCVNPWHLEPVTHRVNMSRAVWRKPEVLCGRGHVVADDAYVTPAGKRVCRLCRRVRSKNYRARKG
jgi:hypothetical protein